MARSGRCRGWKLRWGVQRELKLTMPCAAIALVAPDMVAVLLGPAWAGTAEATRVVALAAMAVVLNGDYSSLFVAVGKARRNFHVAVAFFVIPLAALALIRPETPLEASLVWSAQCFIVPPVLAWIVLRELGRPPTWLARKVAPAVAATSAMAVAVLLLQNAFAMPPPLRLLASASAGAAVYAAVAWAALGGRLPRAVLTSVPLPGIVTRTAAGSGRAG